jgi:hypothetical protein
MSIKHRESISTESGSGVGRSSPFASQGRARRNIGGQRYVTSMPRGRSDPPYCGDNARMASSSRRTSEAETFSLKWRIDAVPGMRMTFGETVNAHASAT